MTPNESERLTKAQASAFLKRWKLVNAREREELGDTTLEQKWQQFEALTELAMGFGWVVKRGKDAASVRERWARLRKAHRG
jgi:hypothetical protein